MMSIECTMHDNMKVHDGMKMYTCRTVVHNQTAVHIHEGMHGVGLRRSTSSTRTLFPSTEPNRGHEVVINRGTNVGPLVKGPAKRPASLISTTSA